MCWQSQHKYSCLNYCKLASNITKNVVVIFRSGYFSICYNICCNIITISSLFQILIYIQEFTEMEKLIVPHV